MNPNTEFTVHSANSAISSIIQFQSSLKNLEIQLKPRIDELNSLIQESPLFKLISDIAKAAQSAQEAVAHKKRVAFKDLRSELRGTSLMVGLGWYPSTIRSSSLTKEIGREFSSIPYKNHRKNPKFLLKIKGIKKIDQLLYSDAKSNYDFNMSNALKTFDVNFSNGHRAALSDLHRCIIARNWSPALHLAFGLIDYVSLKLFESTQYYNRNRKTSSNVKTVIVGRAFKKEASRMRLRFKPIEQVILSMTNENKRSISHTVYYYLPFWHSIRNLLSHGEHSADLMPKSDADYEKLTYQVLSLLFQLCSNNKFR